MRSPQSAQAIGMSGVACLAAICSRRVPSYDHIHFQPHQLRRQFRKVAQLSLVRSEFKPNVLPLSIDKFAQVLAEQVPELLPTGSATHQNAKVVTFGCCAEAASGQARGPTHKCNKLPPLHSTPPVEMPLNYQFSALTV
jgi:hypothetical protein